VVLLPVDFLAQQSLGLELLWRRDRSLGPAGRWLKDALVSHARQVFRD
jgi:DNA-binding transcriptional LysR family regulator